MAIYIGLKLNKLINRLDPNNEAITSLTKLDEIDPVPFNETSLQFFHVLRKQGEGQLFLNTTDLDRYIDIYILEEYNNYYLDSYTETKHEV